MAGYTGFVQQIDQGSSFADAFQKGYGLMDAVYQQQRQNQLRSKLAEMYTTNPDMTPLDRMRKTVPLVAMYGTPEQAIKMDEQLMTQEYNQKYKDAVLANKGTTGAPVKVLINGKTYYTSAQDAIGREAPPSGSGDNLVWGYDENDNKVRVPDAPGVSGGKKTISDYQSELVRISTSAIPNKDQMIKDLNQRYYNLGIVDLPLSTTTDGGANVWAEARTGKRYTKDDRGVKTYIGEKPAAPAAPKTQAPAQNANPLGLRPPAKR